ncbi:hypothetical protein AAEU29_20515 [Pseudoalteromonas sp. SSM20]|uniref:hypothetical protein n=1 Tax=Pseudoalteromonas sp. SSM20 TaxID=3139394 RepID=UPI003BAA4389
MKKILLVAVLLALSANAKAGILSKGQKYACEARVCAIGIAIPESHAECQAALTRWSLYLATIGPFGIKPKCPRKNANDEIVGYDDMTCDSINDSNHRQECNNATAIPDNCDQYDIGSHEWERCERYMCSNKHQQNGNPELCQVQP